MPSYFVTGTSRGLGLGYVTQLLEDPNNKVIATARDTRASTSLQALAEKYSTDQLVLLDFDVTDAESVKHVAERVDRLLPNGIDYYVSNAGVSLSSLVPFNDLNLTLFTEEILFNTVVQVQLFRTFLPLIKKSKEKKVLVMTTALGSVTVSGNMPYLEDAYSVAKAALNMLYRKWSLEVKSEGVMILLIHPGWVPGTEMGANLTSWMEQYAPTGGPPEVEVKDSVAGMLKILREATIDDTGKFFAWDGSGLPW